MHRKIIYSFLLTVVLSFNHAYAWSPFGPNNFEDCVLEGVKDAKSDAAAQMVAQACRMKFPKGESAKKVKCGNKEVLSTEEGSVRFETPLSYLGGGEFNANINRLVYEAAAGDKLVAYVQSNLPFGLIEITLKGYARKDKTESVGSFRCTGYGSQNTVGRFTCLNVNDKAKSFELESVTGEKINFVKMMKSLGECKK